MTDSKVTAGSDATDRAPADGAPRPLRLQRVANRIVRGLLRTPLLCRAVGNRLITLYVVGRKSGRRYVIPVAYTRSGDSLLVGTPFGWGRNLRTGEPVEIQLKGKRRRADVQVFTDEPRFVELYGAMARDNPAFAKLNLISRDAAGNPDPTDLHRIWAAGARAIVLTPQ